MKAIRSLTPVRFYVGQFSVRTSLVVSLDLVVKLVLRLKFKLKIRSHSQPDRKAFERDLNIKN